MTDMSISTSHEPAVSGRSPRTERGGIAAGYLTLISMGAARKGIDCERLLVRAGIDRQMLSKTGMRVSQAQFARFVSLLTRVTQDEMWLLGARPIKPGAFETMCKLIVSCSNMRDAIRTGCRFYHLLSDDFTVRLRSDDAEACIWITDRIEDEEERRTINGVVLFILYGLICWLVGRKLPLNTVHYRSTQTQMSSELEPYYDAPVLFDQMRTELRFDAKLLDLPVIPDAIRLRRFIASIPSVLLVRYRDETSFTERVRGLLKRNLSRVMSLEDVAGILNVSPPTLRRRLQEENDFGFQELKDKVREDVSTHLLLKSRLTLEEIGHSVGFSEISTFHRAFRRWTGQAPGEFRQTRRS